MEKKEERIIGGGEKVEKVMVLTNKLRRMKRKMEKYQVREEERVEERSQEEEVLEGSVDFSIDVGGSKREATDSRQLLCLSIRTTLLSS